MNWLMLIDKQTYWKGYEFKNRKSEYLTRKLTKGKNYFWLLPYSIRLNKQRLIKRHVILINSNSALRDHNAPVHFGISILSISVIMVFIFLEHDKIFDSKPHQHDIHNLF